MWADLPYDVKRELNDPRFQNRTHGSRSTFAAKCHGPLCRKSERDNTNSRHERRQQAKGLSVTRKPRTPAQIAHEQLLETIIDWHRGERGLDPIYQRLPA